MSKEKQNELISTIITKLNNHPNFIRAWFYGSRERGDHSSKSDYDFAFEMEKYNHNEWIKFKFCLEDSLRTLSAVDLVNINNLTESLRGKIISSGRIIYERKS